MGNLDQQVNEEILTELMVQVGPVVSVGMPRDKVTGQHGGYTFVEFETSEDADYAIRIMNGIQLFGKPIRVNKAYKEDKKTQEKQMWQALVFVGHLAPDVDEGVLSKIFSAFGAVLTVNVDRNEDGTSKGYGFVQFDSFESADAAIEAMHRQYVHNQQITVQYARRKDSDTGERHGSEAERRMAKLDRENMLKGSSSAARRPSTAPVSITDLPGVGTNVSTPATAAWGFAANRQAPTQPPPFVPPPPTMGAPGMPGMPGMPPSVPPMGMGMPMGSPMPGMPPMPPMGMPAMPGMGMSIAPPPPPPHAMGMAPPPMGMYPPPHMPGMMPPPFMPPPGAGMIAPPPFRPPAPPPFKN